jgi:hypothetical protein
LAALAANNLVLVNPDSRSGVGTSLKSCPLMMLQILFYFFPALAIRLISFAISSGERIKSIHPLAIALSGISGCAAVSGFCAMVIPPTSLMPHKASAPYVSLIWSHL